MAVPSDFASVLLTLSLDHTFAAEFPQFASKSHEWAEVLDADACSMCYKLSDVCQSLNSTCQFLTAFQQLVLHNITHTHTHTRKWPFVQDYPGEPELELELE